MLPLIVCVLAVLFAFGRKLEPTIRGPYIRPVANALPVVMLPVPITHFPQVRRQPERRRWTREELAVWRENSERVWQTAVSVR